MRQGRVIVGHMSLKSTFRAENTAKKFLFPKPYGDIGTFAPILAPEQFSGRGGAGQRPLFPGWGGAGRGRVENFRGRGGPRQPFPPGPGRGVHPWFVGVNR